MKNKEAAEDVLQDAYLKAFTNLKKLQEPEAFEKWLGVLSRFGDEPAQCSRQGGTHP